MQVILNEQGFVDAYALIGTFGSASIAVNEPENLVDFENNYNSYYLSAGNVLVKNENRQKEIEEEQELSILRSMRENVCFPYINRGYLWYSKLTDSQKEELDVWYQAWLDVTETKVIPEKPEWLM
jgi:hypothetical protein